MEGHVAYQGRWEKDAKFYPQNQNAEAKYVRCAWEYSAETGPN